MLAAKRRNELSCRSLTVAAVGDIMLGTDFPENHLPDDDGIGFLRHVTPTLKAADIAVGNLEGVLQDGGEPVKKCNNPDACYLFRSPTRYAGYLASAGFDIMSLANNHARDFGEPGRSSSMTALDRVGILHSGRVGDVAKWIHDGLNVAFIAFAPFKNSYSMLDIDAAAAEVRRLATEHDIVLASFHGGAEGADADRVPFTTERYYGEDRGDVVMFSRALVDAGADFVIGHGPHVPRAIEVYRERLIAYSLGNFANYYGISVAGKKGWAPILKARIDGTGRFLSGNIVSAIQLRPDGPSIDPRQRAAQRIRELTALDFPNGDVVFDDAGGFTFRGRAQNFCAAD